MKNKETNVISLRKDRTILTGIILNILLSIAGTYYFVSYRKVSAAAALTKQSYSAIKSILISFPLLFIAFSCIMAGFIWINLDKKHLKKKKTKRNKASKFK